jgi:hypothetical protein
MILTQRQNPWLELAAEADGMWICARPARHRRRGGGGLTCFVD